ncbi:MAG: SLC13 family permease [Peptoniphilaceae bacterium]|nr:SLC13 family permease [Peptoniphilaceae bacterium]
MNTTTEKFQWNKNVILKTALCLAVMGIFWILPAPAPITPMGMQVIGIFIGTVLLLSLVDTIWPVFFSFLMLSLTGVMSLNDILKGSVGNWIFSFVVASMIMTNALNESGFTTRLTIKILSMKAAKKSPWFFTFIYFGICFLVGAFMDQVPATAFFLAFTGEILEKIGYDSKSRYANVLIMGAVFAVNLGGAATPISHSLVILGLGIFEQAAGYSINLFDYMIYAVPTTLALFAFLCLIVRFVIKPDVSKVKDLDISKFTQEVKPMQLREKAIAGIFFATVVLWIAPGLLQTILAGDNPLLVFMKKFSITFWAFLAVILLAVIRINDKPLINLKEQMNSKIPWATIFFISIGVLLGSAVSAEGVGLNEYVVANLTPIIEKAPTLVVVFLFALGSCVLTNFSSNVSTITIMTGVAMSVSLASNTLNPAALAITTTMGGCLAFVLPSSFAPIAMLHADPHSDSKMVIRYGIVMVLASGIAACLIGYQLLAG